MNDLADFVDLIDLVHLADSTDMVDLVGLYDFTPPALPNMTLPDLPNLVFGSPRPSTRVDRGHYFLRPINHNASI